jgi:hypothetical protein
MTPEKDELLVKNFPDLYKNYYEDYSQTCMCWGFECPDEWFDIIWNLSNKLSNLAKENNINIKADQVKEKFNGLRFYYTVENGCSEKIYKLINDYIYDAELAVKKLK